MDFPIQARHSLRTLSERAKTEQNRDSSPGQELHPDAVARVGRAKAVGGLFVSGNLKRC